MQFLVSFMDKAIQDNKTLLVVSWKGFKSKPFSLKKSAFKIFILKYLYVKNALFYKKKMKQLISGLYVDTDENKYI